MFVEKLTLFGFKSFNTKVSLDFKPGISGVIGPNGCGKSNIVDALRWVLGEQSTKQLRGAKMEDVIFNGTRDEKPLSLAEVELTLNNDRGIMPIDYGTVSVARRLYRSGVSEYLINKQPVRLRDVRDLFMDTGMGSHAYSVIERQMVDNILSDTTGHRRFLFEEAAGIMKYKVRKKEALTKLEATQLDLVRVNDIITEVERQVSSLGRQVGKARRHKELMAEIRRLDLGLSRNQREAWRERLAGLDEVFQTASRTALEGEARVATLEAHLAELHVRVLEEERRLRDARELLAQADDQIGQKNSHIMVLRERQEAARNRIRELQDQGVRLADREERNAELTRETAIRLEDLARRESEEGGRLETEETALRDRDAAVQARRAELAERKTQAQSLREERIRAEEGREAVGRRRSELEERREETTRLIAELESRVTESEGIRRTAGENLAAARRAVGEAEEVRSLFDVRRQNHESRRELHRRQTSDKRQEEAGVRSRLDTLEGLRAAYEGYDAGVRSLLVDGARDPGVLGALGDLVRVPHAWSAALEPVLGRVWQHVVVSNTQTSRHLLGRLREESLGYAVLVPLDRVPETPAPNEDHIRASEIVETEDRFRPLMRYLLGDMALVPDLDTAFAVVRRGEAARAATRTGELVDAAVVAGGAGGSAGAELVHREEAIERCRESLDILTAGLVDLEGQELDLRAERESLAQEEQQITGALEGARSRAETLEREERDAALRTHHLEERLAAHRDGAAKIEAAAGEAREEQSRLVRLLEEASLGSAQAEEVLAQAEEAFGLAEKEREAALTSVHDRRLSWARLDSEIRDARNTSENLERERLDLAHELARTEREERDSEVRIGEIQTEMEETGAAIQTLHVLREERQVVVAEREREKADVVAGEQADSEVVREVRREATAARQEAHVAELALTELRGDLAHLERRLYEEYEVTPEEMNQFPVEDLPEDAAPVLGDLKDRLKRLGPVNLLAVEEYDEKKERLEFMTTQRDDLQKARDILLRTIEEINKTAAHLFMDTFAVVQENFQKTFQVLFQGGECSLTLVGEDPLEADIDVMARPRGKKPQSIAQLSSGERALTAIALLFAIYLVKPSPFCILDEVDAPLDDANIDRFVNMVREFSKSTQFIVITHNKKTMEAADCLYGVTMQRPGVSSVVSVELHGERTNGRRPAARASEEDGNGNGNGHGPEEPVTPESAVAQ